MLNDNSHMLLRRHLAPTPAAATPGCGEDSCHGKPRPPLLTGNGDQMRSDKRRRARRNRSHQHSDTKNTFPCKQNCSPRTRRWQGLERLELIVDAVAPEVKYIVGYRAGSSPHFRGTLQNRRAKYTAGKSWASFANFGMDNFTLPPG